MAGVLEAAHVVVGLLSAIRGEWKYCKKEDALVKEITVRLYALAEPIMGWANAKEGSTGHATSAVIITSVKQDLTKIKIWLNNYRETGKTGVLARCAKMARNVAQKVMDCPTSFDDLQTIVKAFEDKLNDMLTVAALDLSKGVDDLRQQQQQMMQELQNMSKVCVCACVRAHVCAWCACNV